MAGFPYTFPFFFGPATPGGPTYVAVPGTFGALSWNGEHAAEALALLLEQFQGKTNIEGLLKSVVWRVQELEDATWQVLLATDLDLAADAQLDGIGDIVGEARRGRSDVDYRAAIRVRIAINVSDGTAPEILTILEAFLGVAAGSGLLVMREPERMMLSLELLSGPPSSVSETMIVLRSVKPAGVGLEFIYDTTAGVNAYRNGWTEATDPSGLTGAANGDSWTEATTNVGGAFAGSDAA